MNCEDVTTGFRHARVLMFINEQMAKHSRGPEFYLENLTLSWEEVEEKLNVLLDGTEVPRDVQEACAWSSLALGVRFAFRQGQLQGRRVQWLHDFASLHRSAAHALALDLKKLTDQHEIERKEAAYQLLLAHTKLAEVQRERDLMRLKLLHAVRLPPNPTEIAILMRYQESWRALPISFPSQTFLPAKGI
uniref:Testis expressed 13B n=1 Tax=Mus spicilegus TaxID=10103 RepID=A0A8C6G9J6_MUSSI